MSFGEFFSVKILKYRNSRKEENGHMDEIRTEVLLSLDKCRLGMKLKEFDYPFMILPDLKDLIIELGKTLPEEEFEEVEEHVWISKSAKIFPNTYIASPAIIDEDAEIRFGAFIRGSAFVGKGAVVGNSCEIKNSVLFDKVQVPHYNYVGDSVLGYKAHMGAGSITSNVKSDKTDIVVKNGVKSMETNLRKFGAVLGDGVEIGCSSVLNPGTVIGRNTNVYPLASVRGYVEANSVFKQEGNIVQKYKS